MRDFSELRLHTRRRDNASRFPSGHSLPGKEHVRDIRQNRFFLDDLFSFDFRLRLPGKNKAINPKIVAFQDVAISRNLVPGRNKNQVTGDNFCRIYFFFLPGSYDESVIRSQFFYTIQHSFRFEFLKKSDYRVDKNDNQNYRSVPIFMKNEGQNCRREQDPDQHIVKLIEDQF